MSISAPTLDGGEAFRASRVTVVHDEVQRLELQLESGGIAVDVTDEREVALGDYGLALSTGHRPVQQEFAFDERTGALSITGLWAIRPGLGPRGTRIYLGRASGPWRVEAYRHGHEPTYADVTVTPGQICRAVLRMRKSKDGRWDTWATTSRNRLQDVVGVEVRRK